MYTLKGINVRLFLAQKSGKTAENSRKRGNWAAVPRPNTDSEARHRHRLQVRKANNSSLLRLKLQQEGWLPGTRTNNRSAPSPARAVATRNQLGNRANNRRNLRLFFSLVQLLPGKRERTIIRFYAQLVGKTNNNSADARKELGEKRTKKTRARSSGFSEQSPFL